MRSGTGNGTDRGAAQAVHPGHGLGRARTRRGPGHATPLRAGRGIRSPPTGAEGSRRAAAGSRGAVGTARNGSRSRGPAAVAGRVGPGRGGGVGRDRGGHEGRGEGEAHVGHGHERREGHEAVAARGGRAPGDRVGPSGTAASREAGSRSRDGRAGDSRSMSHADRMAATGIPPAAGGPLGSDREDHGPEEVKGVDRRHGHGRDYRRARSCPRHRGRQIRDHRLRGLQQIPLVAAATRRRRQ